MRWCILLSTLALTTFLLAATKSPPLSILSHFTAPGVPTLGPDEHPVEHSWSDPMSVAERQGRGIAQHPMLYAGEGYNNILLEAGVDLRWK